MTCAMCSPWKRTFTLVHVVPLTMFSPKMGYLKTNVTRFAISVFFRTKVYSHVPFATLNGIILFPIILNVEKI
jgi:hypothetical protein